MKLATLFAASLAAALFAFAAPASATHVQCGDTITQNTALDSDVVCPDGATVGLRIAANDVTLSLAGYTIRAGAGNAPGLITTGVTGGSSSSPLLRVQVRRGQIEGFQRGVVLDAVDSFIGRLTITAHFTGISLTSGGVGAGTSGCERRYPGSNCILRNLVRAGVAGFGGRPAILLEGPDVHVWGNTVSFMAGNGDGIVATGDSPRIVRNTIGPCGPRAGDAGILVRGYITFAMVAKNNVSGCSSGVQALAPTGSTPPRGVRVRRNIVSGNGTWGIFVDDPSAVVANNTANDNSAGIHGTGIEIERGKLVAENKADGNHVDGIRIAEPDVTIWGNTANSNVRLGINAVAGTMDGGENTGNGNGTNCTPNIQCGP